MKIIFMGTPEFAVPSLDILIQAGYDIVAVITAPDRYGGRGRKTLIESDVKKYANSRGLTILQPTNLKSPKFQSKLESLKADIQVVVAFRMLPEKVWNMPPLGTYNLHGSLLPKYRGAAPINWAIINGDTETGVTSFKLKHEIDTGSILLQHRIPIYPFDTAEDLHDRMKWEGAGIVLDSIRIIEEQKIDLKEQLATDVSHAPKLTKKNTELDFSKKSVDIYNMIRGLSPYPTSWFKLDGKHTKVYRAGYRISMHHHASGTVFSDQKTAIEIASSDGYIELYEIQMSGKKRMDIKGLLNGYELKEAKSLVGD